MKSYDWYLKCEKCGFEFSITFDERTTPYEKDIIRKCPCGARMSIEKERTWENEVTEDD